MTASTASRRLHGHFERQVWRLANLKKCMLGANFAILRQVTTRLPHHPYREPHHGLAAARAHKQLFAIQWSSRQTHDFYSQKHSKSRQPVLEPCPSGRLAWQCSDLDTGSGHKGMSMRSRNS
jgi:hypothetical protein